MNNVCDPCNENQIPRLVLGTDQPIMIQLEDPLTKTWIDFSLATQIEVSMQNNDGSVLRMELQTDPTVVPGVYISDAKAGKLIATPGAAASALLAPSPSSGYSSIEVRYVIAGKVGFAQLLDCVQIVHRLFS